MQKIVVAITHEKEEPPSRAAPQFELVAFERWPLFDAEGLDDSQNTTNEGKNTDDPG